MLEGTLSILEGKMPMHWRLETYAEEGNHDAKENSYTNYPTLIVLMSFLFLNDITQYC